MRLAYVVPMAITLGACAGMPASPPAASAAPAVVPQAEHDKAQVLKQAGPTANRGIESVKLLGTVPLAKELDGAGNRILRARELVIAPGGVVAVHQHDQRPGVAYVVEGEMTEFRGDGGTPIVHRPGSAAFEWTGVTHWWENRGAGKARAVVVDIVPAEGK